MMKWFRVVYILPMEGVGTFSVELDRAKQFINSIKESKKSRWFQFPILLKYNIQFSIIHQMLWQNQTAQNKEIILLNKYR